MQGGAAEDSRGGVDGVALLFKQVLAALSSAPPPTTTRSYLPGAKLKLVLVCRVGLALLKTAEEELVALPFEQLLAALNSKRFPAFTKPPGQLMKVAMQIKVSRRLALSEAEYRQTLGQDTPPPPPPLRRAS